MRDLSNWEWWASTPSSSAGANSVRRHQGNLASAARAAPSEIYEFLEPKWCEIAYQPLWPRARPRNETRPRGSKHPMSAVASHADLFFPASYRLAESPLWCPAEEEIGSRSSTLSAGAIHRLDVSHRLQAQTLISTVGVSAIAPAAGGRLLVAAERGARVA